MQAERDYLINHIFPEVRRYCIERGVVFTEVDLRWGITEQEAENGRVIELCLNEIDRSHPFFIGLIGDRYGYVPSRTELTHADSLPERYRWVYDDIDRRLSITEIEIQYGVLRSSDPVYGAFYLRTADKKPDERTEEDRTLDRLKRTIRRQRKLPYDYYGSAEELGNKVYASLIATVDRLYPESVQSHYEKRAAAQQALQAEYLHHYIRTDTEFDDLDRFIDSPQRYLAVAGEAGSGKTALLCAWQLHTQRPVVAYQIGRDSTVESPSEILRYLIYALCRQFGIEYCDLLTEIDADERYRLAEEFRSVCSRTASCGPWTLLIDGIDRLGNSEDQSLDWIPALPDHIKIIYSTRTGTPAHRLAQSRNHAISELPPLDRDRRAKIAEGYFAIYGKRLSADLLDRLASQCKAATLDAFLALLDEIRKYGRHETLGAYIAHFSTADDDRQLYESILAVNEATGDEQLDTVFRKACILLTIVHSGLTEHELMHVCAMPPVVWAALHSQLYGQLTHINGLLKFKSPAFVAAVCSRYASDPQTVRRYRKALIEHLVSAPPPRQRDELAWQLLQAEDFEQLHRLAVDPETFDCWYRLDRQEFSECSRYWDALERHGYAVTDLLPAVGEPCPIDRCLVFNDLCHFCLVTDRIEAFDRTVRYLRPRYEALITEIEEQGDTTAAIIGYVHILLLRQQAALATDDYQTCEDCLSEALRLLQGHYAHVDEAWNRLCFDYQLTSIHNDLGNLHTALGDYSMAERDFRKAIDRSTASESDPRIVGNRLTAASNLAFLHFIQGDRSGWEEIARVEIEAAASSDRSLIASIALKIGKMAPDDDRAIAAYRQAIDLYAELPAQYEFQRATALSELAQRLLKRNEPQQAELCYRRAIELLDHPRANRKLSRQTRYNYAGLLFAAHRFDEACGLALPLAECIEQDERSDTNDLWLAANLLRMLARVASSRSELQATLAYLRRSRSLFLAIGERIGPNEQIEGFVQELDDEIQMTNLFL